ncbi:MAG: NmrA family NAD(P)-binding protein [Prolixibacteraceae bacterium]
MNKIFITGATGNIGKSVVKHLLNQTNQQLVVGVRNIEKSRKHFPSSQRLQYQTFDFEAFDSNSTVFRGIDLVFLLRPPHISDVATYFKPIIESLVKSGVKKVVFLSVQGVEKSSIIPHHKIEKLILDSGLDYVFVRPSYFMQNLTTTFLDEIKAQKTVTVPAGKGIFNWVDVDNIGEATAQLINRFEEFKNRGYDITGTENKSFGEVCSELSKCIGCEIKFQSPSILRFFKLKKKEGMPNGFIVVMIMLHLLPRFQKPPTISNHVNKLTGKKPTLLSEFFEREKNLFTKKPIEL